MTDEGLGSEAYHLYAHTVGWTTRDGRPMSGWFDLGASAQGGWIAVGKRSQEAVQRERDRVPDLVAILVDEHRDGHVSQERLSEIVEALSERYQYRQDP